jgi:hypothetical protein
MAAKLPKMPHPPISEAEPSFPGGPVFPDDPRLGPAFYQVSKNRAPPDPAGFARHPFFFLLVLLSIRNSYTIGHRK